MLVTFCCALFLLLPGGARHALHAQCRVQGNLLVVEAFYGDDVPADDAKVEILDARQVVLVTGQTDDKGVFRTPKPPAGSYTVRVDAGAGHRARVAVTITDDAAQGDGPTRAEATQVPWGKLGLGLLIIAVVSMVLWIVAARRKHQAPEAGATP